MSERTLKYSNRTFRTRPDKLLFGPAGNRLFVDYLDKLPGFSGRIDYLHKVNLNLIFKVTSKDIEKETWDYMKAVWHPEYLETELEDAKIFFREKKYITKEDCAVSIQYWKNVSNQNITLKLSYTPEYCEIENENGIKVYSPVTNHGYRFYYILKTNLSNQEQYILQPNEMLQFVIVAAFGIDKKDPDDLCKKRADLLCRMEPDILLAQQCRDYREFYQEIPRFECSDKALNAAWDYRWYILHNCYAEPKYGNYNHGLMYEGRAHKMGKEIFHPTGWEFTKFIPLSTPLHITDMKWNGNSYYVKEMMKSLLDSVDERGEPRVMLSDTFGASYSNYSIWAFYQYYLIHPDLHFLNEILDKLKKYINGMIDKYTDGKNLLQIVKIHQLTGKEYQPSYWFFSDFPEDYANPKTYTYLKRVDSSIYFYLNLIGLMGLCEEAEDKDAFKYQSLAEQLKLEINTKMWDENSEFYYDIHFETEEKAFVKNIVGFYPWWADIAPQSKIKGFETLFGEEFETEYMFPSVSNKCRAYAPNGGWMGNFIKGRDGCVWDGPSWPYTNGIIIDAVGKQSQKKDHIYDKKFAIYLHRYAMQHFRNGNINEPYLVEHYNPETGEALSDEVDYNHSYFIDLIMCYVLGLKIYKDYIQIDPLYLGLDYFLCTGIKIKNHRLDIKYQRDKIFEVILDGKEIIKEKKLVKQTVLL